MIGGNYVLSKGFLATGGSVAYKRGDIVKFATGSTLQPMQVALSSASNDAIAGVCQEDLDAAKVATGKAYVGVAIMGIIECVFGGGTAIAMGDRVMPGTSGTAKQAVKAATTGNSVLGVAMSVPSAQGDYFSVLLTPGFPALP